MLPSFYYRAEHFPLTNTGKIDKKLLATFKLDRITYTEYESSSNLLQDKIIDIYAEVLHIDTSLIGINAEFFDLGGNSISALRLIHMLNEQFHIKINFSILYDHASVKLLSEQISAILSQTQFSAALHLAQQKPHALKTIKIGTPDKPPIVFLHPIGGTGFCYLDLIKLLPNDQPCYIIQDPSIDANQILFDDIVSMANFYNHLIFKNLHSRQFILAGYSFGGMLALEMVGQLEQKKSADCVQCILSFDTWIVSNIANVQIKANLKTHVIQQYDRIAKQLSAEQHEPQPWMEPYYRQLQEFGMTYAPPKINKKIILFKAAHQSGEFAPLQDQNNYLNYYTSLPIDIHLIDCDHDTILQLPHVRSIGRIITQHITDEIHEMA